MVTNSRRARNEIAPNRRIAHVVPEMTPITKRSTITHHARMRRLMLATVSRAAPVVNRRLSAHPVTDATISRPNTTPISVSNDRSALGIIVSSQLHHRCACPLEELCLVFARRHGQRRAEDGTTQHRYGQRFALG